MSGWTIASVEISGVPERLPPLKLSTSVPAYCTKRGFAGAALQAVFWRMYEAPISLAQH